MERGKRRGRGEDKRKNGGEQKARKSENEKGVGGEGG